ncbi:MAG: SDR family NAD(P)-dependent oxidoreductase [Burkholderiales bacterium]
MNIAGTSMVVTGGASGLGLATVKRAVERGAFVVIADLPSSNGAEMARELGPDVQFVATDVNDTEQMNAALDAAEARAILRTLVHCAGRSTPVRLVEKDGSPGSLEKYETVVRLILTGTFNALRLTAVRMARNPLVDGERGVCILTASIAAFEGQIGQIPYASAKAGVVGMTIVAARDLASKAIRVSTIAPGIFDTPMLRRHSEEIVNSLWKGVPHPARLGRPDEYAALAMHIIENQMLNGETIRLDGATRMAPR